jgi:3-oxoacyl-[acyl-carrier protein] reductase
VTGVSRRAGIGTAIALALARDGWDVARTGWRPYDATMPWGSDPGDRPELDAALEATGARTIAVDADLADVEAPARIFDAVETALGPVTALVLSHCHDVESGVLDTTLESFDRHFGVNARATWLLVRELGRRFHGPDGRGRIVGLTSDHVVGNLPYGASKGALDRIVLAAAEELHDRGITANVVNPGPVDNGWMTPEQKATFEKVATADECAALVAFLCSPAGGRVNGRLLHGTALPAA